MDGMPYKKLILYIVSIKIAVQMVMETGEYRGNLANNAK
jgi:hypothetical protein